MLQRGKSLDCRSAALRANLMCTPAAVDPPTLVGLPNSRPLVRGLRDVLQSRKDNTLMNIICTELIISGTYASYLCLVGSRATPRHGSTQMHAEGRVCLHVYD